MTTKLDPTKLSLGTQLYAKIGWGDERSGDDLRKSFLVCTIHDQNRLNWLFLPYEWSKDARRINKKTGECQGFVGFLTLGEVERYCDDIEYAYRHRYRISEEVERLTDIATLRHIAQLVGYDPNAKK